MSFDPYYGFRSPSPSNFLNLYYSEDLVAKDNVAFPEHATTPSFAHSGSLFRVAPTAAGYCPYTPPYDFDTICSSPRTVLAEQQSQLSASNANSEAVSSSIPSITNISLDSSAPAIPSTPDYDPLAPILAAIFSLPQADSQESQLSASTTNAETIPENVSTPIQSTTNQPPNLPVENSPDFWTPWLENSSNGAKTPAISTRQKTANIAKELSLTTSLLEMNQTSSENVNSEVYALPFSWTISSTNSNEIEDSLGSIKSTTSFTNPKKTQSHLPFPVMYTKLTYSVVFPKGNIDLSGIVDLKNLQFISAAAFKVLQQIPILVTHENSNEIEIFFHPEFIKHDFSQERRIMISTPTTKCVSEIFLLMTQSERKKLSRGKPKDVSKERSSQATGSKRKAPFPEFVCYPLKWAFSNEEIVNEQVEGTIGSQDGWEMQREDSNQLMFFTRAGKYRITLPSKDVKEDKIVSLAIRSQEEMDQPVNIKEDKLQTFEGATSYSFSTKSITVNSSINTSRLKNLVLQTSSNGVFISEDLQLYSHDHVFAKKRKLGTGQVLDETLSNSAGLE